jgi:hypothetical protein
MSELKEPLAGDPPQTTHSEPSPSPMQYSPAELINVNKAIIEGFTGSLKSLEHRDYNASMNLNFPAKILFYLGKNGLIILAILLRVALAFKSYFSIWDLVAVLGTGFLILLMAVALYYLQYRGEQLGSATVVKATEEVQKGLVATLGPTK